ncbi:MAG TPA: SGNH/GDSL hydrolase family protein [bacterium]|nr:SGNH/GDSL hydrolase family protein [bacterium]
MISKRGFIICLLMLSSTWSATSAGTGWIPFFSGKTAATPPEIVYPDNGQRFTVGDTAPDIQWTEVPSSVNYEIEFALDSEFTAPFSLFTNETHLDLGALMDQTTWDSLSLQLFLHVRPLADNIPITDWSEPVEFAKSIAGPVESVSPVDDARFVTGDALPVFEWTPLDNIDLYCIEFGRDKDFDTSYGSFTWSGTRIDCNTVGDPSIWDTIIGTFYWRVCGMERASVPTPFSESFSFAKTTGPAPSLLTPANNSRFSGTSSLPVFTWEPLPHNPLEYHIQFAYGSDPFPMGGGYIPVNQPSFDFASVGITQEMWGQFFGKLRWRVAGLDAFGNHGGFSTAYGFVKISNSNYMAYGDSITGGYGASNWETGYAGYPPILQSILRQRFGQNIRVFCQQDITWFPGGHAYTGNEKINRAMETYGPFKVLIMFGIIDIVDPGASGCEDYDCRTLEHLTAIISKIRAYQGFPCLATITPVNPESTRADLQDSIEALNESIRTLAEMQSVPLADLEAAFLNAPLPLEDYYTYDEEEEEPDWAHFNDLGYQIIAETWNEIL